MTTCAETIKTVLQAFDWTTTTYGSEPSIAILGIDNLNGIPPDKYVKIEDDHEEPEFTLEGLRLQSPKYCNLELGETSTTNRDNLITAIETAFHESEYSIDFSNPIPNNQNNVFKYKYKIKLL